MKNSWKKYLIKLSSSLIITIMLLSIASAQPRAKNDLDNPNVLPSATQNTLPTLRSNWATSDYGDVRIISGVVNTHAIDKVPLGLEFKLPKGWKIYWRDPGDAGLPPTFKNKNSKNLNISDWLWPKPFDFVYVDIATKGYKNHVLFPWDVEIIDKSKPVTINGIVEFLSCNEICVPVSAQINLTIPIAKTAFDKQNSAGEDFIKIAKWRALTPNDQNGTASDQLATNLVAMPSEISPFFNPIMPIPLDLWVVLAIALIGGLILNVMPCALPVLSLKALSIIETLHVDKNSSAEQANATKEIRIGFVFVSLGIIATFLTMAIALSIIKLAGGTVGWGIQFQQPIFLTTLLVVIVVFSGNIFDMFTLSPPSFIVDRFPNWRGRNAKSFFNGFAGAVLATPCSAPFVGTAVAFALARQSGEIILIFLFLAIGMALPYIVIAIFPRAAKILPKPGAWTIKVKKFMGGLMLLTALFIAWILTVMIGLDKVLMIFIMAILIVVLLALAPSLRIAKYKKTIALVLFVAAISVGNVKSSYMPVQPAGFWQKFSVEKIDKSLAEGKIVLVDITALWCVTCKVNEKIVFDNDKVKNALSMKNVVALRGDWTTPDKKISEFLKNHNKFGIPFNIIFSPKVPKGIVLPELLSPKIVLDALKRAK